MNSADCLIAIADALSELMHHTPVNAVTVGLLARVLDGLVDYAAMLTRELEFKLHVRPPLRLVVNDNPKTSRRRRPALRLTKEETP